ncbi:MAG: nuclear transport factor 2 family protein [Gemmatimonadota bacterium]
MTNNAREQEIQKLETAFWSAMQSKDGAGAARMTDDGCIVAGAQGVSAIDAKAMAKMTTEGGWELTHFEFDPKTVQVRFLADDIAIIAYSVSETVLLDGKSLSLKANDASVWVRRDGEWRCALHTESVAGDPFGRQNQS